MRVESKPVYFTAASHRPSGARIVSVTQVVVVLVVVSMSVVVLVGCKAGEVIMPAVITTAARTIAIKTL